MKNVGSVSSSNWLVMSALVLRFVPLAITSMAEKTATLSEPNKIISGCANFIPLTGPHYLVYFNELVGSPENGYNALVDFNLDWGQDLKGLRQWMDKNRINLIGLSYFGTTGPRYGGTPFAYLPSIPFSYPGHEERGLVENRDALPLAQRSYRECFWIGPIARSFPYSEEENLWPRSAIPYLSTSLH